MLHNYPIKAHTMRTDSKSKPTVSIVGARGYSGLELAKLLLAHPRVQLTHCFTTTPFDLGEEILSKKAADVQCCLETQLLDNLTDIVFLATPAEVSMRLAPAILNQGKSVVDLSGAFRLKASDIPRWYGFTHTAPDALAQAQYGLQPFCPPRSNAVRLVANPGCYATAISLALIPLLKHGVIEADGIVIDAKSGTTGGGRKPTENLLFSEVSGECLPYRVGRHQHLPEIQETVQNFAGVQIDPHFVTHLLSTPRGILASIFARAKTTQIQDVHAAFAAEYGDYPLVHFGTKIDSLAKLKNVVGTPYCHLSYELTQNKLYLFSALDNLMKGAASQAVENMNQLLDLPRTFSLIEGE